MTRLGLIAVAIAVALAPTAASANACPEIPDLTAELDAAADRLAQDPAGVRDTTTRLETLLVCLTAPAEPTDLVRLWQLRGLAHLALGDSASGARDLRQAASVPLDEPIVLSDDIDAIGPYLEAYSGDWKLGRLIIGPVSMDARVHVDGIVQNRTFAPVRAPALHLVQVVEGDAIVFAKLVDSPEGDLDVDTTAKPPKIKLAKAPKPPKEPKQADRQNEPEEPKAPKAPDGEKGGGRGLRVASIAAGGAALGLGAASFYFNHRAGSLAASGDRSGAARAFDTHQTLAVAGGALGVASALGFGLSLTARF